MSNVQVLRHAHVLSPQMELSDDEVELIESMSADEIQELVDNEEAEEGSVS